MKLRSKKIIVSVPLAGVLLFATAGCSAKQPPPLPPGVMSVAQTQQAVMADEASPQRQAAAQATKAANALIKPEVISQQH